MKDILDQLFSPRYVAVIGASDKINSVGYAIYRNLRQSPFPGVVWPVNIRHAHIQGDQAFTTVKDLPGQADLAIIATPEKSVLEVVKQCGKARIKAVIIITAGFLDDHKALPKLKDQLQKLSRRYQMRILGPNSFGIINTSLNLNATFAHRMAAPGHLALLSQSGALCASLLDWSIAHQFGFRYFISLGSMVDLSFHEMIDYLGSDSSVSGIIIYMESLQQARPFISAGRAFARTKPILVLKAGTSPAGASAILRHTGLPSGYNLAFDALFRRVGILRVHTLASLFFCAKGLAMQKKPRDKRLAIISNAGGPAILATDYLLRQGGDLAELQHLPQNVQDTWLSPNWSRRNPLDLSGDAQSTHFRHALDYCLQTSEVDGILVIFTPQAVTDAVGLAHAIIDSTQGKTKTVLTSFMGRDEVHTAVNLLETNFIPNYAFPENAVEVFLRMAEHQQHINLLYETVPSTPEEFQPNPFQLQILAQLPTDQHLYKGGPESQDVLSAFQIPYHPTFLIRTIVDLERYARELTFPWKLKYSLAEAEGLAIHSISADTISTAFKEYRHIHENLSERLPTVWIEAGLTKAEFLNLKLHYDDLVGPLITLSTSGPDNNTLPGVIGIPPLNMALAKDLLFQLKSSTGLAPTDTVYDQNLHFLLVKVSYLAIYLPQVRSLEAKIFLGRSYPELTDVVLKMKYVTLVEPYSHLAIAPYPIEWVSAFQTKTGTNLILRPIRPEDEPLEQEFFTFLSKESLYFRFFGYISGFTQEMLSRFTHIDYDREMALIALTPGTEPRMAGVVRIIGDAWKLTAEYAIIVADEWQGQGIGKVLTETIIGYARQRGYQSLHCSVLCHNDAMLSILKRYGFTLKHEDADVYFAELSL